MPQGGTVHLLFSRVIGEPFGEPIGVPRRAGSPMPLRDKDSIASSGFLRRKVIENQKGGVPDTFYSVSFRIMLYELRMLGF